LNAAIKPTPRQGHAAMRRITRVRVGIQFVLCILTAAKLYQALMAL
jgi:hypothetical protein